MFRTIPRVNILNTHEKTLEKLVQNIPLGTLFGTTTLPITNIQYDSRNVIKKSLFCALRGVHVDGHDYIKHAIEKGATAILCSPTFEFTETELEHVGVFTVQDTSIRNALAEISEVFFDFPADELKIIGVTGTDGKSTTIFFIHQLLTEIGIKSGFFSTVQFFDGETYHPNITRQSTPESPELYESLYMMKKNNCSVAIIETTSHGLSEKTGRTHGLSFKVGVVTHIGQEHLDFHKTMEQYILDKANLFGKLQAQGSGIIREEEEYINYFQNNAKKSGARLLTYSIYSNKAQYSMKNLKTDIRTIEGIARFNGNRLLDPVEAPFYLRCIGEYNAENALAAIAAVHQLDIPFENIVKHTTTLIPPKGRMKIVRNDLQILPIIDYAHTPSSFEKILKMMQNITKQSNENAKLLVVFGSAGERDTEKRPIQGALADKFADIIVLTNEDPRGEDELTIIQEIGIACNTHTLYKDLFYIPNRKDAIRHSLTLARAGDTIMFLGKGHEKTIIHKNHIIKWDEEKVVNDTINELLPSTNW